MLMSAWDLWSTQSHRRTPQKKSLVRMLTVVPRIDSMEATALHQLRFCRVRVIGAHVTPTMPDKTVRTVELSKRGPCREIIDHPRSSQRWRNANARERESERGTERERESELREEIKEDMKKEEMR